MTNDELLAKCSQRQSVMDIRTQIQAEIDGLSQEIGTELGMRKVELVDLGEYVPKVIVSTRKTLDKVKLVELGVPITVIEAATTETEVQSLRVDRRKAKG